MNRFFLLICIVTLVALNACQSPQDTTNLDQQRPYDPWISRSVLDEQPRMLTLALHDDLWVAYSTENCALYKAWKGYVNFEGAVYNTAHGPQPVSIGDAFIVNVFEHPWRIAKGTNELNTRAQYVGHRIQGGSPELMYDIYTKEIGSIRVYEKVDSVVSKSGQIGLSRTFTTENVPEGYSVLFLTNINSIVTKSNIQTDGELKIYEEENQMFEGRELVEIEGHIILNSNSSTSFNINFIDKPTIKNTNLGSDEKEADLPFGQRLISRNDCKTCHNTNVQTIGPSYIAIAKRYPTNDKSVNMLVKKVIAGGAGIWGIQVMSPHPEIPKTDVEAMVEWILSLDTDEEEGFESQGVDSISLDPIVIEDDNLIPGAITEVYQFNEPMNAVPIKPNRQADMAGIMAEFGNISNSDFTGLFGDFALYAYGYLYFKEAGDYIIRLWSDDGSTFWLNDALLIDFDGPHSTSYKEVAVTLKQGFYPFRLEYYQGGGDRFLSLNCLLPNTSDFITMTSEMYFHDPEGRKMMSGKSLPMSVVSQLPGDQTALIDVHPSYDLSMARPYDFLPKVGGMDFLANGDLAISTWDPSGSIYRLSNTDADNPADIVVKKIAFGLAEPLGLKVVDDVIYVLQKQELTRLVDTDGDQIIDEYQTVSNQWKTSANFHEFAFGLEYEDGFFYANLATAIQPGGTSADPQIKDRGKVMRINATNGNIEFIAFGLRTPNGIGYGVDGELFISDNQGDWLPSSKIMHVKNGAFFGSRSVDFEGTANLIEQPPVVWLPQDEIGNSPSTPMLLEDGPYAGQMMHGEVTHGGLKRVFVEKVNGDYQGVVFRFIQGLEAGINRMKYAPDGSLYVGGIGNPGNWAQVDKLWYGLQRLKYNGKSTFEMLAVRAKSNGVEIEFTEPLKEGDGWNKDKYEIRQWKYVPTAEYGGPKVDEKVLSIRSVNISDDRLKVFLELDEMEEGHVLYIHLNQHFISAMDGQLWATEAWYTMNNIPSNQPGIKTKPTSTYSINTLTNEEKADGWKLLSDGKSFDGWRRFNQPDVGKSWIIADDGFKLNAKRDASGNWLVEDRGDLMTIDEFENFELILDWKISNCGNSGIMYSVVESEKYHSPWQTGPEVQVIDQTCHPDGRYPTHRSADLYDMVESKFFSVKPAGEWNSIRLIKNGNHVEHWLNGIKVVEYEIYTPIWEKMIANSKFRDMADFGKFKKGHITLQDHGDAQVWYRNIKIKEL